MNQSSSATWVKGVLDMSASQVLDVRSQLRGADHDAAARDRPGVRITADAVIQLRDVVIAAGLTRQNGAQANLPWCALADLTGFGDQSIFLRASKRGFGMPLRECRRAETSGRGRRVLVLQ